MIYRCSRRVWLPQVTFCLSLEADCVGKTLAGKVLHVMEGKQSVVVSAVVDIRTIGTYWSREWTGPNNL